MLLVFLAHPKTFAVGDAEGGFAVGTEIDVTFAEHPFQLLIPEVANFHFAMGANGRNIIFFSEFDHLSSLNNNCLYHTAFRKKTQYGGYQQSRG